MLCAMQRRRNQLELDKFASENELEQRIADIHSTAEDVQTEKEAITSELVHSEATVTLSSDNNAYIWLCHCRSSQVERLREALAASVKESDHLSAELDRSQPAHALWDYVNWLVAARTVSVR